MGKIEPQNNRFYLSRKLVVVVTLFIITASVLVVLTNFSINMIAASRDYTALLSRWSQQHYKVSSAVERYGRTGDPAAYQSYQQLKNEKEQIHEPIDELFKPEIEAQVVFESLRSDEVNPNEISALILAFERFSHLESIREIRRVWQNINEIDLQQSQFVRELHREWEAAEPDREQINLMLTELDRLNSRWDSQNSELMAKVRQASLGIKRFGLWLSVILGILLVLIGVVVSVRASKSISRWEHALNEKGILLAEIHHRVKNNLAVISGLLELESMENHEPEQALQVSRDRIHSMAMIHEILYQSNSFSEIKLDDYISKLSDYICKTHIGDQKKINLETDLENITLNINQAVPAGLILNELLANAIEHGFSSSDQGTIIVRLEESEGNVCLSLHDNGKGLPENFDYETAETTGFTIIQALVRQLDAEFQIRNTAGTTVELEFHKSDASGPSSGHL